MVSDFVHQYEVAIDARYFKEKEKDVRTKSTCVILKTPLKIEEKAAFIYIRKSFMIFQDELLDSLRYISRKLSKKGESKKYGVTSYGKDTLVYHVTLESGEDVTTCTCHKWEFIGILCKHILCVFGKKGLDELMESKGGKKNSSSSKSLLYEAPLGYSIEDVRPHGGIKKFRSAAYSNCVRKPS
ncbi:hypothetical protein LWI28_007191 [Acer negundo]|uniref:SWIM-type domain-containing protein n=1 Tax=Acer negundo TaxID=4023 RepID=A0AAD5I5R6_ACENE|nr:hypothetical protein LWI28_007191 [Acer negundo]